MPPDHESSREKQSSFSRFLQWEIIEENAASFLRLQSHSANEMQYILTRDPSNIPQSIENCTAYILTCTVQSPQMFYHYHFQSPVLITDMMAHIPTPNLYPASSLDSI